MAISSHLVRQTELLKANDTVRGRTPHGTNPLDADFNPGAAFDPEEFQLNAWSPRRVGWHITAALRFSSGYLVDLAAPGTDRLLSVFVSDQSTRVACISQNGAYARPFVSHGSINRKYSTKGLISSALSGLRAISMSKDSMLMLT